MDHNSTYESFLSTLTISFGGSFHDRRVTGLLILTVGGNQVGGLKVGRLLGRSDVPLDPTITWSPGGNLHTLCCLDHLYLQDPASS